MKIKYILIFVLCFFCLSINTKALNIDSLYDMNIKASINQGTVVNKGSQKESDSEYTLDNITDFDVESSCCELQPFLKILKLVISILQFSIPLLLIVLGTFDMFKAVTSGDEKVISDVRSGFIKRIIYGVIIFLVPFFVSLILNLVNDALISDDGLVKSTTWIDCWQGNVSCSNKS